MTVEALVVLILKEQVLKMKVAEKTVLKLTVYFLTRQVLTEQNLTTLQYIAVVLTAMILTVMKYLSVQVKLVLVIGSGEGPDLTGLPLYHKQTYCFQEIVGKCLGREKYN